MPVVPLLRRIPGGGSMPMTDRYEIEFAIHNPGASGEVTASFARKISGGGFENPRVTLTKVGDPVTTEDGVICYRGKADLLASTTVFEPTGNLFVFMGTTRILPPESSTNPNADAPPIGYAENLLTTSTPIPMPIPIPIPTPP